MTQPLTIALTKGRILKETLPLLAAAGIAPLEDISASRKLIFPTNVEDIQLVVLRGSDVPTYVRYGAADMGISGKDMLLENDGADLYEPLDLGIARCRLMTAGLKIGRCRNGACVSPPSSSMSPNIFLPSVASRPTSSSCTARWNWRL